MRELDLLKVVRVAGINVTAGGYKLVAQSEHFMAPAAGWVTSSCRMRRGTLAETAVEKKCETQIHKHTSKSKESFFID